VRCRPAGQATLNTPRDDLAISEPPPSSAPGWPPTSERKPAR